MRPLLLLLTTALLMPARAASDANYSEAKVGSFTLPPLLVARDGSKITTAGQWTNQRRAEILELFREHVYGHSPAKTDDLKFEVTGTKTDALGGSATRKFVHLTLTNHPQWRGLDLMLYVPNGLTQPAPVFVGLSFGGNHAVATETDVPLNPRWMPAFKPGQPGNQATEAARGNEASRWPLETLIKQGYAVATAYCGDLEPDHPQGWKDGLRAALSPAGATAQWQPNDWGAIGAWAWGLSRILDYLETDRAIDAKHAAVIGHSRLGKTALWAGAQDERFAITFSNESGEGGAALSRRNFGETTKRITSNFPHWFCSNYVKYGDDPNANPVDQHMLIALAAPRPIYIASAEADKWSDPRGEFLSGQVASEVWALFGRTGTGTPEWPAVNQPVGDCVGYHLRSGQHDVIAYDWEQYLKFANRHFARNRPGF
jgi:hypothetical protein